MLKHDKAGQNNCVIYIIPRYWNYEIFENIFRLKINFKNAGLISEKCGESTPIFVNVNMYVSKSCAAISSEFPKSSEMAAHDLDTYT